MPGRRMATRSSPDSASTPTWTDAIVRPVSDNLTFPRHPEGVSARAAWMVVMARSLSWRDRYHGAMVVMARSPNSSRLSSLYVYT